MLNATCNQPISYMACTLTRTRMKVSYAISSCVWIYIYIYIYKRVYLEKQKKIYKINMFL